MAISEKLNSRSAKVSIVHAVQNSVQAMIGVAHRMDRITSGSITKAVVCDKAALASFPYCGLFGDFRGTPRSFHGGLPIG